MPIEAARQADWQKRADREIRRLRLRMEQIAQGSRLRATEVIGVLPPENRPVEWWYGGLLGLGVELELHEGDGVWITGTFAAGRAHYYIGAYAVGGGVSGTVAWYANQGLLGNGLEVDLREASDVWISGTWVGNRAVYYIGTYGTVGGGGLSGTSFNLNDGFLGFGDGLDNHEGRGVWISGSFASGEATYTFGVDGRNIPYDAADVDDWDYAHSPSGVAEALDQLADRLAVGIIEADGATLVPASLSGTEPADYMDFPTYGQRLPYMPYTWHENRHSIFKMSMPEIWNGGVFDARFHWTHEEGITGTFAAGIRARCYGDGETIDAVFGTAQEVLDISQGEGRWHITSWMTGLAPAGTPAGGEGIIFDIYRNTASDNLLCDARVLVADLRFVNRRE